jgi:ribosomal protein S18 acetylase RimI-like enzyme
VGQGFESPLRLSLDVDLRAATTDDRGDVELLLAEYLFEFDGRTEPYPHIDAYWTEAERLPFLVDADGDPVGVCLIRVRDGGWSIVEFAISPPHRKAGVGRAAVDALADRARAAGAAHLEAKIHPDNEQAFGFWSAVGFERIATTPVLTTRRQLG